MTRVYVRKIRPPDELGRKVRVTVARPLPQDDAPPCPFEYAGPGGPRFDAQGMVVPHSILGCLEDFKTEMQLRGETELVRRIPGGQTLPPLVVETENDSDKAKDLSEKGRSHQSHALQHWYRHMTERRRQQDFISRFLQKPAASLLMNRSGRFRRIQEQRDRIQRGHHVAGVCFQDRMHVGSEFWSLPQRYGDEMSGITATLTRSERGNPPDATRIGQTLATRLESGTVASDAVISGWDQSLYLQQRLHELKDTLRDFSPEVEGLEVLGSGLSVTQSPLPDDREEEEEEDEEQKENEDPLALFDDVISEVELRPALRVCGDLALWTGSTSSHQGQEGVSTRLMFETVMGQSVSTDLELKNEGSTAIYYSWERLTPTYSHTQHFYFNNTTAAILPGSTKRISFTFKSASAGIMTEVWRLNTHPVLMGGASLQVTLRGVALDEDKSAQQRAALEKELERKAAVSLCRWIITDLLRGVRSPERPSSPDDLYITDEELFLTHNPDLQYHREPVEALRGLWEQVSGRHTPVWDLSLNTLRQVVLSIPETDGEIRETCLSQFNSLMLELQRPQIHTPPVTSHIISLQLWRELMDGLVNESVRLRHKLGLPENNTWSETTHNHDTLEQKEEQRTEGALLMKDAMRRASVRELEESRAAEERGSVKKLVPEERRTGAGERDSSFTTESAEHKHTPQDTYRALLHTQVYALMERMVDSLCDLLHDSQTAY